MSRYVGTGEGVWAGESFRYVPSVDDRLMAADVGRAFADKRRGTTRGGYGQTESRPAWHTTGFLGEVAALYPLGSGPEVEVWESGGDWYGRPDYGRLEVRTTGAWQLYAFAASKFAKQPGLAGWRVTPKDRGRVIVCVEARDADFMVLGWARADDIPRLVPPLGRIIAVIEPPDLRPLLDLDDYAAARQRTSI